MIVFIDSGVLGLLTNPYKGAVQQHEQRLRHRFLKVKRRVQRRREARDDELVPAVAQDAVV